MTIESITSDAIPQAPAPISQAIRAGGLVFLSGQVGVDPASGSLVAGDAAAQMEQALENLTAVLDAAGRTLADVARVGVYLADMRDYAAVNEVYGRIFEPPYPARTAVAVAALPLGASVEVDAVAVDPGE